MTTYRVAGSHVLHEVIDDEVIVVDFSSGSYYSLKGTAADSWCALVDGATPAQVVALLTEHYTVHGAEVVLAVDGFIESLAHEGLLVEDGSIAESWSPPPSPEARRDFLAPVLEKFTDMEDLILIDPVHDVSTTEGWPHRSA